ncbi:hypothetical protein LEP1GSC116_0793, partial [Leptospira interrogans serovar Icterohaemorrhagiae str. Verdun HP]
MCFLLYRKDQVARTCSCAATIEEQWALSFFWGQ